MITTYHGKNRYLAQKEIKRKIIHTDPFNVTFLGEPTLQELSIEINTSPLLGTRRFIIVDSIKNLQPEKRLIGVLENKRETSHVIFTIEEYGKKFTKLNTYLKKFQVIKINQFDEKEAIKYAKNAGGLLGLNFGQENDVAHYFIFLVGTAPEAIDLELDVLKSEGKTNPSYQDIAEIIARRTDQNLFKLVETIYTGKVGTVVDLVSNYIVENPQKNIPSLLHMLIADLKIAILLKSCLEQKIGMHLIPISSYRLRYMRKKISTHSLTKLIDFFCSLNEAVYYQLRMGNDPLPFLYASIHQFRGRH